MPVKITCPHCGSKNALDEPFPLPGSQIQCADCAARLAISYPNGVMEALKARGKRFQEEVAAAPAPRRETRPTPPPNDEASSPNNAGWLGFLDTASSRDPDATPIAAPERREEREIDPAMLAALGRLRGEASSHQKRASQASRRTLSTLEAARRVAGNSDDPGIQRALGEVLGHVDAAGSAAEDAESYAREAESTDDLERVRVATAKANAAADRAEQEQSQASNTMAGLREAVRDATNDRARVRAEEEARAAAERRRQEDLQARQRAEEAESRQRAERERLERERIDRDLAAAETAVSQARAAAAQAAVLRDELASSQREAGLRSPTFDLAMTQVEQAVAQAEQAAEEAVITERPSTEADARRIARRADLARLRAESARDSASAARRTGEVALRTAREAAEREATARQEAVDTAQTALSTLQETAQAVEGKVSAGRQLVGSSPSPAVRHVLQQLVRSGTRVSQSRDRATEAVQRARSATAVELARQAAEDARREAYAASTAAELVDDAFEALEQAVAHAKREEEQREQAAAAERARVVARIERSRDGASTALDDIRTLAEELDELDGTIDGVARAAEKIGAALRTAEEARDAAEAALSSARDTRDAAELEQNLGASERAQHQATQAESRARAALETARTAVTEHLARERAREERARRQAEALAAARQRAADTLLRAEQVLQSAREPLAPWLDNEHGAPAAELLAALQQAVAHTRTASDRAALAEEPAAAEASADQAERSLQRVDEVAARLPGAITACEDRQAAHEAALRAEAERAAAAEAERIARARDAAAERIAVARERAAELEQRIERAAATPSEAQDLRLRTQLTLLASSELTPAQADDACAVLGQLADELERAAADLARQRARQERIEAAQSSADAARQALDRAEAAAASVHSQARDGAAEGVELSPELTKGLERVDSALSLVRRAWEQAAASAEAATTSDDNAADAQQASLAAARAEGAAEALHTTVDTAHDLLAVAREAAVARERAAAEASAAQRALEEARQRAAAEAEAGQQALEEARKRAEAEAGAAQQALQEARAASQRDATAEAHAQRLERVHGRAEVVRERGKALAQHALHAAEGIDDNAVADAVAALRASDAQLAETVAATRIGGEPSEAACDEAEAHLADARVLLAELEDRSRAVHAAISTAQQARAREALALGQTIERARAAAQAAKQVSEALEASIAADDIHGANDALAEAGRAAAQAAEAAAAAEAATDLASAQEHAARATAALQTAREAAQRGDAAIATELGSRSADLSALSRVRATAQQAAHSARVSAQQARRIARSIHDEVAGESPQVAAARTHIAELASEVSMAAERADFASADADETLDLELATQAASEAAAAAQEAEALLAELEEADDRLSELAAQPAAAVRPSPIPAAPTLMPTAADDEPDALPTPQPPPPRADARPAASVVSSLPAGFGEDVATDGPAPQRQSGPISADAPTPTPLAAVPIQPVAEQPPAPRPATPQPAARADVPSLAPKAAKPRKAKKAKPPKSKRRRRLLPRLAGMALVALILLAIAGGIVGFVGYSHYSKQLPTLEALRAYQPPTVTTVYDHEGQLLGEIYEQRRYVTPIEEIPEHVQQAFTSAEDKAFWSHGVVNWTGLVRATIVNFTTGEKSQGASTITMQVTRNFLLTRDKTYERKIKEIILAQRIEQAYDKEHILYLYLNELYLGSGAYGVEAAARTYFGKHVQDLSIAEAALIAGLAPAPSTYSPHQNFDRAKVRQGYVLDRMLADGHISQSEYDTAKAEELVIIERSNEFLEMAPYFTEHVRRYIVETYGHDRVYNEGLQVTTTCDLDLQQVAQDAVKKGVHEVDQRMGFRREGLETIPVSAIPERRAAVESEIIDAWVQEHDPAGQLERPATSTLEQGELYTGILTEVDRGWAKVAIGSHEALIPLEWSKWVFVPDPARSWRYRTQDNLTQVVDWDGDGTDDGAILQVGDVVRVKVMALSTQDEEVADAFNRTPGADTPLVAAHLWPDNEVEAALLSYELDSGAVRAMVGGSDFADSEFNRATQAYRQVGSTFKPIVYAAAIESKKVTAASMVTDGPLAFATNSDFIWKPSNYSNTYLGNITLRKALALSRNTCTVRVLDRIDPGMNDDIVYTFVRKLGIGGPPAHTLGEDWQVTPETDHLCPWIPETRDSTICMDRFPEKDPTLTDSAHRRMLGPDDNYQCRACDLSMGLGSASLTMSELMRAYSAFGSGGKLIEPYYIEEVRDRDGNVLEQHQATEPVQVLDPGVASITTWLMQGVVQGGTAGRASSLGLHLAGKTGTTNDEKDMWFVGFNPDVITAVWVGYDQPRSLGVSSTGGRTALPIWMDYMRVAVPREEDRPFRMSGVEFAQIEEETGRRVTSGGRSYPFLPDTVPESTGISAGQVSIDDLSSEL